MDANKGSGHGGKRKGAGRKPKAAEQDLQRLLNQAWPRRERAETIKKFVARANKGDLAAFQLLMAYSFGKPRQQVEHTGEGGGPLLIEYVNNWRDAGTE